MLHFNLSTNVTYVLGMYVHSTYKNYNNFILSSNVKLQTYRPYHNSSFFIVCSVYIFIPSLKSRHDKLIEYRLIDILFRFSQYKVITFNPFPHHLYQILIHLLEQGSNSINCTKKIILYLPALYLVCWKKMIPVSVATCHRRTGLPFFAFYY